MLSASAEARDQSAELLRLRAELRALHDAIHAEKDARLDLRRATLFALVYLVTGGGHRGRHER